MDRREAIKGMAIFTTGLAFLSSCKSEEAISLYKNLSINKSTKKTLQGFCDGMIPFKGTEIQLPEENVEFLMVYINDCFSPEDISKYEAGLDLFINQLSTDYSKSFDALTDVEKKSLFNKTIEKSSEENLKYFAEETKKIVLKNFTTSEDYLKKYKNYNIIPQEYQACISS